MSRTRTPRSQQGSNKSRKNTPTSPVEQSRNAAYTPVQSAPTSRRSPLPAVLLVALLLVLAVGTIVILKPLGGSGPAVAPSQLGRISFVRKTADSKTDLYIVNPDGSGQQQATQDVLIEGSTKWSPDGRQIIAQVSVNGTSTVVRINIGPDNKGSNAVQLTADAKGDSVLPAWSPDGKHIAFQSKREGGDYQLFVMDRDGNNKRRLSDGKGYAGQPAWSPDGQKLVYIAGEKQNGGTKDIYVVPFAGGASTKLTPGGKDISTPQWSPDGTLISYLDNQGQRNNTIMIMNADGTAPRVLVNEGANFSVRFSPDSKQVLYYSVAPPNGSDIYIVPVAGGSTQNLTHLSADDYQPVWSPDGKRIAWAGKQGEEYKIIVGDVAGADQQAVSSGSGNDYQPEWAPPAR